MENGAGSPRFRRATARAEALSKDLRTRGFRFVGPTICYAFMQAVGMVNDHLLDCAWHDRVQRGPRQGRPASIVSSSSRDSVTKIQP